MYLWYWHCHFIQNRTRMRIYEVKNIKLGKNLIVRFYVYLINFIFIKKRGWLQNISGMLFFSYSLLKFSNIKLIDHLSCLTFYSMMILIKSWKKYNNYLLWGLRGCNSNTQNSFKWIECLYSKSINVKNYSSIYLLKTGLIKKLENNSNNFTNLLTILVKQESKF